MPNYTVNAITTVTNTTATGTALSATIGSQSNLSVSIPSNPNIAVSITGARVGVVYVSGPAGSPGVISATYPVLYDSSSKNISLDLSYFSGLAAGVSNLNGITGQITIQGAGGNLFVTTSGQKIFISGSGIANSGDVSNILGLLGLTGQTLYNQDLSISGVLQQQLDQKVNDYGDTISGRIVMSGEGIQFYPPIAPAYAEGLLYYDTDNHALTYYNNAANTPVHIGQESIILVVNKLGHTVTGGQAVYISGAQGNRPTISLARANSLATATNVIGLVSENIADNAEGYIVTQGVIGTIDTSPYTAGDTLYLSSEIPGGYTAIPAPPPNHPVEIGVVLSSHPTQGKILVMIEHGSHLSGAHDVLISSPSQNSLITWQTQSGRWENVLPVGSGNITISTGSGILIFNGETGNFSGLASKSSLESTGSSLYNLTTGASGYLLGLINASSGGVSSLNSLSGTINIQGAGNVSITTQGQNIVISGNTGDYALFALKSDVTQTGISLLGAINSLSGWASAFSGILESHIAQTGQSSILYANGISGNLQSQINSLPTSNQLYQTGLNLYNLVTGLSGQSTIDYATKDQLTLTGINLLDAIAQTGQQFILFTSGASGILQTQINSLPTTSYVDGIGINLSGDLTLTGQILQNRINSLSGFVVQVSGGLESRITQSGNAAVSHSNSIGASISGDLSQTGSTLWNRDLSISGALQTLIDQANADVNSINGQSGALTLTGTGTVTISSGGQGVILISGREADFSGYITTGDADLRYYPNSTNPSGYVTGEYYTKTQIDEFFLYQNPFYFRDLQSTDITGHRLMTYGYPTGHVPTTGTYVNVVNDQFLTGFATPSGQPGLNGFVQGENIASIHAWKTNSNQKTTSLYYKLYKYNTGLYNEIGVSATSHELTTSETHLYINEFITGLYLTPSDRIIINWYASVAGVGVNPTVMLTWGDDTAAAESLPFSASLLSTTYYPNTNPSGFITSGQSGQFYPASNPQQYVTSGNLQSTGQQAWNAANNNALNLSGNLAQTGATLIAADLSLSGALTGRLYQSGIDLYNQIYNSGQTLFNRDSAISGALDNRIIQSGNSAINHANGIGINLSGNLTQTGIALILRDNSISGVLQGYIDSISAGTGFIGRDVVYTSGNQYISGTKYFIGNTYVDNLFVTGTQFVVNTQDLYVGNNWIILNATGGARDSALFVATGFTGMNATGGIIGFDVPSNTWRFGIGGYMTDLSSLAQIASVSEVINASGGLNSIIIDTGNSSVLHANGIGINLSGNLTLTGSTLDNKINSLSGFVSQVSGGLEARITQSGNTAIAHSNGIGVNLSGNLTQTGITLISLNSFTSGALTGTIYQTGLGLYTQIYDSGQLLYNRDNSISGGLEARITASGNASIAHANGIGSIISGNLTQSGATLNNAINTGLNWVNGIFVHRSGTELISGQKTFVNTIGLTGIQFNGASGSGLSLQVDTDGSLLINSTGISGSILSVDSNVTGALFSVVDEYESPLFEVYSDSRVIAGTFNTNALFVSGSGVAFGTTYVDPYRAVLISGDTEYRGEIYSGSINIVNLYYPRSNPSGFITGLAGTGSLATLNQLNSLSGFTTGFSGVLDSKIANTGSQAWNAANNNGINLSGNLTATGQTLYQLASGTSGNLSITGVTLFNYIIGGDTNLSGNLTQTGQSLFNRINSVGTTISGNLTTTGQTLYNLIVNLSGIDNGIFVHRTGNELISGFKTFTNSIGVTGIQFNGASGSGISLQVGTDGGLDFYGTGTSGSLLGVDNNSSGSLFAVTNAYESPLFEVYDDGRVIAGTFNSNAFFVSGSGVAFGVGNVPSGYAVFISGNTQYIGQIFSGTTNIADIFYPRNNPSGFITLSAASGSFAQQQANYFYRTGAQTVSGNTTIQGNITIISGQYEPFISISSNYSVLATDKRIYCNNINPITLTMPSAVTSTGQLFNIKLINTGAVYLTGTFTHKFDGSDSYTIAGQYQTRQLHSDGVSNWYIW